MKNNNTNDPIKKLRKLANKNIEQSGTAEEDNQLKAILTIMKELAYTDNHQQREDIFIYVSEVIYSKTDHFGKNREDFIVKV